MRAQLFPTIGPAECRSYIATARLQPNAVSLRIHALLEQPKLIRRCMYCHADFGTKPCVPEMAGKVSHGVCPACVPTLERDFGVTLQRGTPTSERPIAGSERGYSDGARCHAASVSQDLEVDAYHNKQATERSLAACENQSGDLYP